VHAARAVNGADATTAGEVPKIDGAVTVCVAIVALDCPHCCVHVTCTCSDTGGSLELNTSVLTVSGSPGTTAARLVQTMSQFTTTPPGPVSHV
jgi:hypothetical protein